MLSTFGDVLNLKVLLFSVNGGTVLKLNKGLSYMHWGNGIETGVKGVTMSQAAEVALLDRSIVIIGEASSDTYLGKLSISFPSPSYRIVSDFPPWNNCFRRTFCYFQDPNRAKDNWRWIWKYGSTRTWWTVSSVLQGMWKCQGIRRKESVLPQKFTTLCCYPRNLEREDRGERRVRYARPLLLLGGWHWIWQRFQGQFGNSHGKNENILIQCNFLNVNPVFVYD